MQMRTAATDAVLYARVAGELDLPRAMRLYQELIQRWRADETPGILIDCRPLVGSLTDLQRYEVGVQVAGSYAALREAGGALPRIAMLALPPLIEPRRFIQTVASNRGARLRAFESVAEAAEWLGVDPAVVERLAAGVEGPAA